MRNKRLAKSELHVMNILWEIGRRASTNEILDRYDDPKPAYNTISTILTRLTQKGYVAFSKRDGKTYFYYPLIPKKKYQLSLLPRYANLRIVLIAIALGLSLVVTAICLSDTKVIQWLRQSVESIFTPQDKTVAVRKIMTEKDFAKDTDVQSEQQPRKKSVEADIQKTGKSMKNENEVCESPDQQPEFKGGDAALRTYVEANRSITDRGGKIYVRVLIDHNGKVKNVETITDETTDMLLAQEAMRLVYAMPEWIPARKDGEYVSAYVIMPIIFQNKE